MVILSFIESILPFIESILKDLVGIQIADADDTVRTLLNLHSQVLQR